MNYSRMCMCICWVYTQIAYWSELFSISFSDIELFFGLIVSTITHTTAMGWPLKIGNKWVPVVENYIHNFVKVMPCIFLYTGTNPSRWRYLMHKQRVPVPVHTSSTVMSPVWHKSYLSLIGQQSLSQEDTKLTITEEAAIPVAGGQQLPVTPHIHHQWIIESVAPCEGCPGGSILGWIGHCTPSEQLFFASYHSVNPLNGHAIYSHEMRNQWLRELNLMESNI